MLIKCLQCIHLFLCVHMQVYRGRPDRGEMWPNLSSGLRCTQRPGICSRCLPLRQVQFPSFPSTHYHTDAHSHSGLH